MIIRTEILQRVVSEHADSEFMVGFRSLDTELDGVELAVDGHVPSWLSGSLVRNGPGLFRTKHGRLRHWFDGLAMLRKYEFDHGAVSYSNRFLRTEAYEDAMAGRPTGQFATDERGLRKVFNWVRRLGPPKPTDNANVHVARLDGKLVAQTEVPRWATVDADTLETTGEFQFADLIDLDMITAHLIADPRGGHVGHGLSFGRTSEYCLFQIPPGSRRRELIATIPTETPAYVHEVAVSERYIALIETPLRIDLRRALSPFTEGFFELLEWQEETGTTLYLVDRESGDQVTAPTVAPFFTFHVVNAFDDGTEMVVDLIAFADDSIVDALSLDVLETEGFDAAPPGRLTRLRIDTDGSVSSRRLYDGGMELPTVRADRQTREYRYAYGQATDRKGANGLVKVDTERERATEFWERDLYIEEPLMIPRSVGSRTDTEKAQGDDGVILAPALDTASESSVLLVLDAETLTERARAFVPHHNPFGFHGRFFPH